ncbi:NUDIX domain-containing protein [Octadecabacter sp.]|nr:NUDIX domain-containing protein [Octadecabacter sp.]
MSKGPSIKTTRENLVFENEFLRVYNNDVLFPSGKAGTYVRTRWAAPHGVGALPIWNGNLLLMRNYRYSEDRMSVEIPQGFGIIDSAPEDDIQRELHEEIGCKADALVPIGGTGFDYRTHLFLARMPSTFVYNAGGHETGEAFADPLIVPITDRPEDLIEEHGIFDAITQMALMRLSLRIRDKGLDAV